MRNPGDPYLYSVGGRVHFDETTEEALLREVREETGADLEVDRPLFFQEQFFDEDTTGEHIHEIAVYYLMKDRGDWEDLTCGSVTERGNREELVWIPLEDLDRYYVVPVSVAQELKKAFPDHMVRIVEVDKR